MMTSSRGRRAAGENGSALIESLVSHLATDAAHSDGAVPSLVAQVPAELDRECRRFTRHLIGLEPTTYQISKYADFHRVRRIGPRCAFDGALYALTRSGVGLVLADAYTGTLYRRSLVRTKLMLSVAILECSPPSFVLLDRPDRSFVFLRMALRTGVAALWLLAAVLVIAPLHVLYALTGRTRPA